jgi:hypothetical protein
LQVREKVGGGWGSGWLCSDLQLAIVVVYEFGKQNWECHPMEVVVRSVERECLFGE